jgi:hypothetical protein
MPRDTDYLTHPKQDHVRTITSGNANVEITPVNGKGDVTITVPAPGSGFGAVESVTGGDGISVAPTTGDVVVTNTGALSVSAGNSGVTVSPTTGAVVVTRAVSVATPTTVANAAAAGTSAIAANQDHVHLGVAQIIAGTNITVDPVGGTGAVTVNASASGGASSVTAGNAGLVISPTTGAVIASRAVSVATPAAVSGTAAAGTSAIGANQDHAHEGVASLASANAGITASSATGAVTITRVVTSTAPTAIASAGAAGTGVKAANDDHTHAGVTSLASANAGLTASASQGAITLTHVLSSATPLGTTSGGATGTGTIASREDHRHPAGSAGDPYTAGDGIRIDTSTLSNKDHYQLRTYLDWIPASPNSEDQEWNSTGTTPPSGWAWMNQTSGTPSTTATMDMHTNRPSCLELTAAQSSTIALRGIFRAVPNSGSWQYRAQIFANVGDTASSTKTTGAGSWGGVGLMIADNSLTGLSVGVLMGSLNGDLGSVVYSYATPTSAGSAKNTDLKGWSAASIAIIKFDGTNLFFYAADNNGMQVNLYRVTPATIGLANITTSQIGIIVHNLATTATVKAYCDYFRRDS